MITVTGQLDTKEFEKMDEPRLRYSSVERDRWNVLDLLNLFGRQAASTYIYYDIDMSWVNDRRAEFAKSGQRVTPTAFLLKAISHAQKNHPASRTFMLPGLRTVKYEDIVAGFTIEREVDSKPVVFFGEIDDPLNKSVKEIANCLNHFARDDIKTVDKLHEQLIFTRFPWFIRRAVLHLGQWFPYLRLKCMRATFGFSSLGALGVNSVSGPSVCTSVFGVGTIKDTVVVRDKKIVSRPILTLILCFDQKVMDAGLAALFMKEIKELVEGGLEEFLD